MAIVRAIAPGSGLLALLLGLSVVGTERHATAADDCVHVVKKGDTLSRIARRHGVSEKALVSANSELRKNPNLVRPGQKLEVCAARRDSAASKKRGPRSCGRGGTLIEHEVRKGDTLARLARKYGVPEAAIVRRNAALKRNPDLLRRGQKLTICADQRRTRNSAVCDYETPLHRHVVVPGEHLGQIAGSYGVRRRDLVRLNPDLKKNPNVLRVGQRLRVCPDIAPRERQRLTHAVQRGETLSSIAKKYDLTTRELERYQRGNLKNPNSLRPGQRLVVWVQGDVLSGFANVDRDSGVLKAGVQLPPGRHYHVKWRAASWGTAYTVRALQSGIATYKRRMPGGPKVHVGDLSTRGGGSFPPHKSHQHGRDVDIGYVLRGSLANETRFRNAGRGNLDVARTWMLVKSLIDTNAVSHIFMDHRIQRLLYEHAKKKGAREEVLDELFQYPRGPRRGHGIIRHWKGHTHHFHVRFRR
jgi:LysM repeat protein